MNQLPEVIEVFNNINPPHWATLNTQTNATDPKFSLVNGGSTTNIPQGGTIDFEAKLMANGYLPYNDRNTYFQHSLYQELHNGIMIPTLYEKYTLSTLVYDDYLTIYEPIQKSENLTIPWIVLWKGTDSLMDVVKDVSILRSYYTNDWLSTRTYTTTNQLDQLIQIIKPIFENSQRKVHFISHSLGSYMSNYVAYKLVSSSSLIRLHGLTQSMYAELQASLHKT